MALGGRYAIFHVDISLRYKTWGNPVTMRISLAFACGIFLCFGVSKAFSIPPAQNTYRLCRAYNIGTELFKKRIIDEVYYFVEKGDDYYSSKPYDFYLTFYARVVDNKKYNTEELKIYTDYLCRNNPNYFADMAIVIIFDEYAHKYHMFQETYLSSYALPSILRVKKKAK